ncbi:thymidylate synthase [Batrachochytrium salamandrivorans]|nr:thymidylate synthase [Batrachochytrium salamandrivorans]
MLQSITQIIGTGDLRKDRWHRHSVAFAPPQLRFSLADNTLPLLTTKRTFLRPVFEELMWFIRGQTDSKILAGKGVHIWDANGSREALDRAGLGHRQEGDLGRSMGFSGDILVLAMRMLIPTTLLMYVGLNLASLFTASEMRTFIATTLMHYKHNWNALLDLFPKYSSKETIQELSYLTVESTAQKVARLVREMETFEYEHIDVVGYTPHKIVMDMSAASYRDTYAHLRLVKPAADKISHHELPPPISRPIATQILIECFQSNSIDILSNQLFNLEMSFETMFVTSKKYTHSVRGIIAKLCMPTIDPVTLRLLNEALDLFMANSTQDSGVSAKCWNALLD